MQLDRKTIQQFVNAVTPKQDTTPKTYNLFGTIQNVDTEGGMCTVQLDGSSVLTSALVGVDVKDGDRVVVMMSDHTATIANNLSNPASAYSAIDIVTDLEEFVRETITPDLITGESLIAMINLSNGTAKIEANNVELSGLAKTDDITGEKLIAAINLYNGIAAITAKNINLNGLVTANSFFKINEDGSIQTNKGVIGGWDIGENYIRANVIGEVGPTLSMSYNGDKVAEISRNGIYGSNFKAGYVKTKKINKGKTIKGHVTFDRQFPSTPIVTIGIDSEVPSHVRVSIKNRTPSGFDYYVYSTTNSARAFNWQAFMYDSSWYNIQENDPNEVEITVDDNTEDEVFTSRVN